MKKRFVEFIDKNFIAAACKQEDVVLATNICAKFCVSKFGLKVCAENPMEINSFCMSTLLLAKEKTISSKKVERAFDVKKDLFNALMLACRRGEHHLPIIGYIEVSKKHCFVAQDDVFSNDVSMSFNEDLHLSMEIFTHIELTLLLELDGNITLQSLEDHYNFKRAEAIAIKKNIQKKIIYLRLKI